jgi:hypothetical protein
VVNRIALSVVFAGLLACACTAPFVSHDCEVLVGPEPWLILGPGTSGAGCVEVGVHQDLQIWNKGTEPLSLEWQGASIDIPSDDKYATGPIGEVAEPGVHSIESDPYWSPMVHVRDPDDSFSAGTELAASGFGSIEIGMTLTEASAASGQTVVVDPDLSPGPDCWLAIIEADPYSPLFTVAGDGTENSKIEFITAFHLLDETGTIGSATPLVPSLCG